MTAGAFVPQAEPVPRPPGGRPGTPSPLRRARLPVVAAGGDRPRRHGPGIGISYADPYRDEKGWAFTGGRFSDEVNGWELPERGLPRDQPRLRRPHLRPRPVGQGERQIVSNESADIVEIFDEWTGGQYSPADQRALIAELNEWIYSEFQNGVYRAGFSRSQEAYDEAFRGVFAALDRLEDALTESTYLAGDEITLADWRVLPTLLRFDAVYHTHFRCNGRAADRLPAPDRLHEGPLRAAARRRDVRARRDQAPLLHDPRRAEPQADHPAGPARPRASLAPEGPLHLALELALLDRVALVADVLAAAERDLHLRVAALEVEPRRDQRQPLLLLSCRSAARSRAGASAACAGAPARGSRASPARRAGCGRCRATPRRCGPPRSRPSASPCRRAAT